MSSREKVTSADPERDESGVASPLLELPEDEPASVVRSVSFVGDERALIAGVSAGNPAAAAALYHRYVEDVRRMLLRLLGPTSELNDVVHESYIAAYESIQHVRDPAALRGWMRTVAINTARKHLRARQRLRWIRLWRDEQEASERERVAPAQTSSIALAEAWQILDRMTVDDRMVFALRFIEGMELQEIATELAVSLSTVKRRLARASTRFEAAARHTRCLRDWQPGGAQ